MGRMVASRMANERTATTILEPPGGYGDNWTCPWCGRVNVEKSFHEHQFLHGVHPSVLARRHRRDEISGHHVTFNGYHCAFCYKVTITMLTGTFDGLDGERDEYTSAEFDESYVVFPLGGCVRPVPPEIPQMLADAFREAGTVLEYSPNATAVLCRRALQLLLRQQPGVTHGGIYQEIESIEGQVPPEILRAMHALRDVSAAGAHPSVADDGVVNLNREEATVLLRALWTIMEHFYPPPADDAFERLHALVTEKGQAALRRLPDT